MRKHDSGFVGRPERAADDPAVVLRAAGRRAVAEARDHRLAERRAEVRVQVEASAARHAAAGVQRAAPSAERRQWETGQQVEQKARRDAHYAAQGPQWLIRRQRLCLGRSSN